MWAPQGVWRGSKREGKTRESEQKMKVKLRTGVSRGRRHVSSCTSEQLHKKGKIRYDGNRNSLYLSVTEGSCR